MEKTDVKAWVEENIRPLMAEYGIPHWKITVEYALSDTEDWAGEADCSPEYEIALIKLNCPKIEDEKDLIRVFRHELCHVLHSPFNLYEQLIEEYVDESLHPMFHQAWLHAAELTVLNLERMHQGHVDKYTDENKEPRE